MPAVATDLKRFSKGKVGIDNKLSVYAQSISVDVQGGQQPVSTIELDVAGNVQGPSMLTIKVSQAVPVGGAEFDAFKACVDNTFHTISVQSGGATLVGQCWCKEASIETTIDGEDKLAMTFEGPGQKFKVLGI